MCRNKASGNLGNTERWLVRKEGYSVVISAPRRLRRGLKRRLHGSGTELLKAKVLLGGPCESGKTILAYFLTQASDITEYNPTQGVRILEFENPRVTSKQQSRGVWIWALGLWWWSRVRVLLVSPDEGLSWGGDRLQCQHPKSPEGNWDVVFLFRPAAVLTEYSVSVNCTPQTRLRKWQRKPSSGTTLEQAEAGALESWGLPRRDQDGIHPVFKKHNQLSVREQRPGRDVHYYLTGFHLEASTSQMKLMSVQSLKSIHLRRFSSPSGYRRRFPCLPQRPVSQGVDSIPSVLHP